MRQLGLAVANHESATGHFPLVSTTGVPLTNQAPGSSDDGYSVFVKLLPYMEERILYDEILAAMLKQDDNASPFGDAAERNIAVDEQGMHFAERQIPAYRCPSYHGDNVCMTDAQYAGGAVSPAVGNYVAIVATDLEGAAGTKHYWKRNYKSWENGALVSSCWDGDCITREGLTLRQINDGISKQLLMAESCERRYASWFSSASTWVVAATGGENPRESGGVVSNQGPDLRDGFIELTGGQLALNWGDTRAYHDGDTRDVYLTPAVHRWAGQHGRVFGPSSDHSGDVILHVFADAHALPISSDVDPHVYLRLISRADGDPAPS